jgi:hypothetical protein
MAGHLKLVFALVVFRVFLFQSALAFPMRTKDNSGMFCGGQFSVLDFAFFLKFTIWSISAYCTSMGLGQRLDSKGARRDSARRKLSLGW